MNFLASLAADGEGSPVGDVIRANDTAVGFLCMGAVVLVVLVLAFARK